MKYREKKLHCSERLMENIQSEIAEIEEVVNAVQWKKEFSISFGEDTVSHQQAYNKAFEVEFLKYSWETQPKLKDSPRLIGDFSKGLVFIEIQFGNSSTLYRDFYKFQYENIKGSSLPLTLAHNLKKQ